MRDDSAAPAGSQAGTGSGDGIAILGSLHEPTASPIAVAAVPRGAALPGGPNGHLGGVERGLADLHLRRDEAIRAR